MLRAFKNMKVIVLRRKFASKISMKKFHEEILLFRKQVIFNMIRFTAQDKCLQKVMTLLTG